MTTKQPVITTSYFKIDIGIDETAFSICKVGRNEHILKHKKKIRFQFYDRNEMSIEIITRQSFVDFEV